MVMAGIFVALVVLGGILSACFGFVKKALEVISLILKFCICAGVVMIVCNMLSIEFSNTWKQLLVMFLGGSFVFGLIQALASMFRLVGYSINYFMNSFIVLIVFLILAKDTAVSIFLYSLVLLLVPRIMWISDRMATSTDYSHSEYSFFSNIRTDVYVKKNVDWWEESEDAWNHIPVQIAIASVFYILGSITTIAVCPIESALLTLLYLIIVAALNVLVDFFGLRNIEMAMAEKI